MAGASDHDFRRNRSGQFAKGNRGGPGRPPQGGEGKRRTDEKAVVIVKHRPPPVDPPSGCTFEDEKYWAWESAKIDWLLYGMWTWYEE